MGVALSAVGFVLAAAIVGIFIKPNADQTRPLEPQPSTGEASRDHHH